MRYFLSVLTAFPLPALLPSSAFACTVCFGSLNINMSKGFFWGIVLLLALPFAMAAVLVALVARHARKHRRDQIALAGRRVP